MAMYTQVNTTAAYVGLNAFAYIMQTVSVPHSVGFIANVQLFNAVLYASAPELFATAYRGSASGMLSALGRIAGIVAPFAGQAFLANDSSGESRNLDLRTGADRSRYPMARCWWYLALGFDDGVPTSRDEEEADVLIFSSEHAVNDRGLDHNMKCGVYTGM